MYTSPCLFYNRVPEHFFACLIRFKCDGFTGYGLGLPWLFSLFYKRSPVPRVTGSSTGSEAFTCVRPAGCPYYSMGYDGSSGGAVRETLGWDGVRERYDGMRRGAVRDPRGT